MPTVFVISRDWTLRVTVRAELLQAGVNALGMESAEDVAAQLAGGSAPSAMVLDAGVMTDAAPDARAALANLARGVPILVVGSRTERAPELEHAAAIVYRPVRVAEIVAHIRRMLQGQAA